MALNLEGKGFLVAAASKGLGFGVAETLVQAGAGVAIGSRSETELATAAERLRGRGAGSVYRQRLDVSCAESIAAWVADSREALGRVDGLVLNAGGPEAGRFEGLDDAAWGRAFQLTLMSAVRLVRAVLPHLREVGGGAIVAITSSTAREPLPEMVLSNVFRAGVTNLVKTLSRELAVDGVRVNAVAPGRFNTERVEHLDHRTALQRGESVAEVRRRHEESIPLQRLGAPLEFGAAVAFLLSEQASYITGVSLPVDGGKSAVL